MQANQTLQEQIDGLRQEESNRAAQFSSQAEEAAAEKAVLQQDLLELNQKLKAAETGQADLQKEQELWKSKCSKHVQAS